MSLGPFTVDRQAPDRTAPIMSGRFAGAEGPKVALSARTCGLSSALATSAVERFQTIEVFGAERMFETS
jgi:hypothetical protein